MNRSRPRRRPRPRLVAACWSDRDRFTQRQNQARIGFDTLKRPDSETCSSPPEVFDAMTRLQRET
jgi:hypothetical protein